MYTSILNTIDDSDKQLGFLFTKRENTHLIQLCEYFDERLHDQIQPVDVDEIDARCTEGTSTIANTAKTKTSSPFTCGWVLNRLPPDRFTGGWIANTAK
jgi:hypothetical protein